MFSGKYLEWNQKRIKGIIDFYGHKFIYCKKMLDLGCGQADISGAFYRLGADIIAVDARQEHLSIAGKKFPGLKTVKADLDRDWAFAGKKYDIVLDLGIICHLRDYEQHLRNVCQTTNHLVLETAVCDSDDPYKCITSTENKNIYDLSVNGVNSRPTAAAIERILTECGMNFRRVDDAKFNAGEYSYNWQSKNDDDCSIYKRRIWFAVKNSSAIQIAKIHKPEIIEQAVIAAPISLLPPSQFIAPLIINTSLISGPPSTETYSAGPGDKKFVIVIPSYNNARWCEKNITSTINQNYDKYRVIFTDDCSADGTYEKVFDIVSKSSKANKFTLIKNTERVGALENLYNMIHSCDDDEIILTLDGDDWFPDDGNVLKKLNEVYSQEDIWMTYGQYRDYPGGSNGIADQYPPNVVAASSYRSYRWCASHLRTFYTWLFKKIKKEDLMHQGKFMMMTWDLGIMFPMLEMAGQHSKFIRDILYIYNMENPINDHKVNVNLQQSLDHLIRTWPKYSLTQKPPVKKTSIGLLLIATGKYDKFIQGMISSADKYFLNDKFNVTYYVFSDKTSPAQSKREIVYTNIEHKQFPFASMDRFKHFTTYSNKFNKEDYLYYVDVDCLFVDNVGEEIIGDLVGVKHCGYLNAQGPYEPNQNSSLYADPSKYKHYFGGGFSGGKKEKYLDLSKWCYDRIEEDVSKGIMPVWHDETALNRYFSIIEPTVILDPGYHYPQSNIGHYQALWAPETFIPKILLLDKNHAQVRS